MARTARTPQRSKRDRFNAKVHDRIALARAEAAVRREAAATREVALEALSDLALGW